MSKAAAGLGKGLAIVGEYGLREELLRMRDERLAAYESQRQDRDIASREKISGQEMAQRADLTDKEIASRERVGFMQEAGADRRLKMQLEAKDTKPVILPRGARLVGAGGEVLATNDTEEDKTITVPEGAAVVDRQGNQLYKNEKAPGSEGLPKTVRDLDERVEKGTRRLVTLMGGTMDAMGRYSLPANNEADFARADKMLGELIRNQNMDPEAAAEKVFQDVRRNRSLKPVGGEKEPSSKAKSLVDSLF